MSEERRGAPRPDAWRRGKRVQGPQVPRWRETESPRKQRSALHGWRLAVFAGAAVAACILWLVVVVWSPRRTPIILAACTGASGYRLPYSPFALIDEDLTLLKSLDGKNISLWHAPDGWASRDEAMELLDRQIRAASNVSRPPDAVILYVAMHGDVDDQGRACLVPSGASPLEVDEWIPVEMLLGQMRETMEGRGFLPDHPKLVVLDCVRSRSDWRRGLIDSRFAVAVDEMMGRLRGAGFAVLLTSGPGEASRADPQLGASSFAVAFQRGLAGEADANGDGAVFLEELNAFVSSRVDARARTMADVSQTCKLYTKGLNDVRIAWAVREQPQAPTPSPANIAPDVVDGLWRARERLAGGEAARRQPLEWANQLNQLLWLEQAAAAGRDYRAAAEHAQQMLAAEMANFTAAPPLGAADSYATTPEEAVLFGLEEMDGLPLIEALNRFAEAPSPETLAAATAAVDASETQAGRQLAAGAFLKQLARMQTLDDPASVPRVGRAFVLQRRLDQLVAMKDPRAQYFLESNIEQAVGELQRGVDYMFAGAMGAGRSDEALASAEQLITNAEANAREVYAALIAYDEVSCRMPRALGWLDQTVYEPSGAGLDFEEVRRTADRLVADLDALAAQLAEPATNGDQPISARRLVSEVNDRWKTISSWVDAEYDRLLQADELDAAAARDGARLVAAPVLPSSQNGKTGVQRRRELAGRVDAKLLNLATMKIEAAPPSEAASERPSIAWAPAAALLADRFSDPDAVVPTQPVEAAKFVRSQLRQLAVQATAASRDPRNQRKNAFETAHRVRVASVFPVEQLETNPYHVLGRIDLRRLELRLAERRLDEFWGPTAPGLAPFFDEAARGYVQAGAAVLVDDDRTVALRKEIEAKLIQANAASHVGMTVQATDCLMIHPNERVVTKVRVQAPTTAWPEGAAVVVVRGEDGRLTPYQLQQEAVGKGYAFEELGSDAKPSAQAADPLTLVVDDGAKIIPPASLSAVAFFRGHEGSSRFLVEPTNGPGVVLHDQTSVIARVTVLGAAAPAESLVLILDVSQTMKRPTRWEGPALSTPVPATRLEAATTALSSLLGDLSERANTRVGVRFYGHRVGWDLSNLSNMLQQLDYAGPPAQGVTPSTDVESVLQLGRFDAIAAGSVRRLLGSLRPWGESPIYLALSESAQELANEPGDVVKRIILITDGGNYQSRDETPLDRASSALASAGVQLNVLSFSDDASEPGLAELKQLATTTGGSFAPVQQATDLLRKLQALTKAAQFTVADSTGAVESRTDAGKTDEVPLHGVSPRKAIVALQGVSQNVELFGGEALQLAPEWGRLVIPFDDSIVAARANLTGGDEAMEVIAETPHRSDDGVEFRLVLRRRDGLFTPRPRALWVEATPVNASGASVGPPHVVYDAVFAEGCSLPTLEFAAADWPDAAARASITVSIRDEDVAPIATGPGIGDGDAAPIVASLPGGGEVRVESSPTPGAANRLLVVGRYQGVAPTGDLVRIAAVGGDPPDLIRRRMDVDDLVSVHEFAWNGDVPSNLKLELTPKEAIISGARHTAQPLLVTVNDGAGLLPLAAPLVGPPPAPPAE